ncbi:MULTISPECIES: glycosyltransferase family 4 protein [unclassified Arthrobacter]|uniref:glycosyltransferase family 4 protein n=1 Tax=unclassified Arthrobacter TaxID=235627 RepID=UPI00040D6211|nr:MULTISPECIES: glycosyltransferase family 1 protein [unclassified Arthrobacter]PVE19970.1 glycosyltransferase family 1 protein [Arthrobacter sp. Bz4]
MRILFDARFTRLDHHDGISRYGASLIAAVAERADVAMLISDHRQLGLLPDVPHVLITSPLSPRELFVASQINGLRPDVVVCPMQTMGSWGRKYPLVLTLHDLIYYQNPQPPGSLPLPVRTLWRLYHLAYWPQRVLLNRADVVATISETTRGQISEHRLTRRPVRIVGNAPQPDTVVRPEGVEPGRDLLYMGSFMPYKNVETILAGMRGIDGYTLHLLSRITDARRRELELLIPPGQQVIFHNGVSDERYQELLRSGAALVTLSRAEGYGLPVIEAMAAGTPVIAADTAIFREVGGAAALYVDPDDPTQFTAAVKTLAEPDQWHAASRAGRMQAGTYSWDRSAEQLLEAAAIATVEHAGKPRWRR